MSSKKRGISSAPAYSGSSLPSKSVPIANDVLSADRDDVFYVRRKPRRARKSTHEIDAYDAAEPRQGLYLGVG